MPGDRTARDARSGVGRGFVRESARYLREVYLPRIRRALDALPGDRLWHRPHAGAISVGTILRHLDGNVRQWILSGIGGAPDGRDRASEFERTDDASADELFERLSDTVTEAARAIEALTDEDLAREQRIQGYETTALEAVYHVVEHFSWHTGQAVWIAKARGGPDHGIAFYDDAAINAARNG